MATEQIFLDLEQGETVDKLFLLLGILDQSIEAHIIAVVRRLAPELEYRHRRLSGR
jgi:hypothetical protein